MPVAVTIDLGARHAYIGDQVVGIGVAPGGPPGSLAVGPLVLRPLSFGERQRLVADVAGRPATTGTLRSLATSVLVRSLVSGGKPSADTTAAVEALALHLAGARLDVPSPGFVDSVGLLTRAYGWGPDEVASAAADLMDELARSLADAQVEPAGDDGWTSIVLAGDGDVADAPVDESDVEAIRDRLAMDLLRRKAVGGAAADVRSATEPGSATEQPRVSSPGARVEPARSGAQVESGTESRARPLDAKAADATVSSDPPVRSPGRAGGSDAPVRTTDAGPAAAVAAAAPVTPAPDRADPGTTERRLASASLPDLARSGRQLLDLAAEPGTTGPTRPTLQPIAAGPAWSSRRTVPLASEVLEDRRSRQAAPVVPAGRPDPATDSAGDDLADIADRLAEALDDEADLRGLRRS